MPDRLESSLPTRTCRGSFPFSMLVTALLLSGGCADGAESPSDDGAGTTNLTSTATATATDPATATATDPGSTSGGDTAPETADTGEPDSTTGTGSEPTTSPGATGDPTDTGSDSGGSGEDCQPGSNDVTAMGSVVASSTFGDNEYPAALSVDGDPATSWFSAGPGPKGGPARFAWTIEEPRCLSTLVLTGNGGHANPDFHEQFGFEAVTVRVFLGEKAVFQMDESLAGTPDPTVTVELGEVFGDRVELELSGHEDPICGGFAELQLSGA